MLPCATCDRDPVATAAPGTWEGAIAGKLRSTFLVARQMLPLLSRGRDPALVLAASCLGAVGRLGYRPCSAARAGVIALTRTLALEAAPLVRVNCVAPHIEADDEAQAPLGRSVMADDVAGPLLFLLGPAARYMTGQTLHVNGGAHMP
jgi:3-oxoacyl-[acyl-carrier protein] reductase